MLKVDRRQVTIWETVLPPEMLELPEELAKVDELLGDPRFLEPFKKVFHARWGRPSIPVATFLRMPYLKHRHNLGDETLVREVSDSIQWRRRFCHLGLSDPVPDATTLIKLVKRVGPEVIEELNRCLVGMAREKKVIRGQKLRVDSTVVESDIHHPTDARLLADGIRVVTRIARQLKALGVAVRTKVRDRTRAVKKRLYAISRVLRRRTGEAWEEVRMLTGQVADIAQKVLRQVEGVVRNGRRKLARMEDRSRARAKALLHRLESYANRLWTAVIQSDMLQGGDMRIPERMVSLCL